MNNPIWYKFMAKYEANDRWTEGYFIMCMNILTTGDNMVPPEEKEND